MNRFRQIRKELNHLFRRTKMPFVVPFQETPSRLELGVIPNASEHVQEFTVASLRVANAIRGEKRQAQCFRQAHCSLIPPLFDNVAVSLQFDIYIFSAENSRQ